MGIATRALGIVVAMGFTALAPPARAGADAAVRKVLDAQVAAIAGHVPADFAAGFADKPFAMLPGGYARTRAATGTAAARGWWSDDARRVIAAGKVASAVIGVAGDRAWLTAEVALTGTVPGEAKAGTDRYRVTELFVQHGGAWQVHATFWSQARADRPDDWSPAMFSTDDASGAPALDRTSPGATWIDQPADLAKHLRAGKDVIVLGSGPGERGAGPAGGRLLTSWKKIAFGADWVTAGGDGATWAWLGGRISRQTNIGADSDPRSEPYWALLLLVKGPGGWEVVSAHYGQTMPAGGDG
jgi:hypothetical protein